MRENRVIILGYRVAAHAGRVDRNSGLRLAERFGYVAAHAGRVDRNCSLSRFARLFAVAAHAGRVDRNVTSAL